MRTFRQFRRAVPRLISGQDGGVKISELPDAVTVNATDQVEVNQGGTSRRMDLSRIASARTATVTYYVATTGSDTSDGLSDTSPVLTFQRALDLCATTAAYSRGPFTIQAAAGTYTVPTRLVISPPLFIGSTVTLNGHVTGGVPDVIIQGSTDGTRTHNLFDVTGGVSVIWQDVFFQSFVQPATVTQFARLSLVRCWAKNCFNVLSCGNGGFAAAFGGDWDGRDLAGVPVPTGNGFGSVIVSPFNLTQPPDYSGLLIHHWDADGVLVDECGSGHMDYLRIEDCNNGVRIIRGAGMPNMRFVRIYRCTVGILAKSTTHVFIDANFDFGQGTPNACATNLVCTAAPVYQQEEETAFNSRLVYMPFSLTAGGNLTNDTAERALWDPLINITKGRVRAQDTLDVHMYVHGILSVAGTLRLYFGSTLVQAWSVPIGMADARIEIMLEALNATDWRGQVFQLTQPASPPSTTALVPITDKLGLTSLTADTEVSLTWQAGALVDFFQMRVGRIFSSVAGLGFA